MKNDIRFALLGTGNIAGKYAQAIGNIDDIQLVGVAASTKEKARYFAEKNCIEYWSDDLGELSDQVEFDAVIIATPNGMHHKGTVQAAMLKKHVLCEKPLDIALDKIDLMISTCAENGVKLGCSYQHRTSENNILIHDIVQSGKLGKIYIANAFLKNYRGQEYYSSAAWRGTWALDGGGPFIQQASHTIDLMVWIMGDVKEVFALTNTVAHDIEVEDMGHAIVKYANGAQGLIEASTVVKPGYPNRLELHGELGSIILSESEIVEWSVEGIEKPEIHEVNRSSGAGNPMAIDTQGHERILRDFRESILLDRQPMINGENARKSIELILSIYESARKKTLITF